MSDISLYRKYRPQTFAHLCGQDHIRTTLLNAIQEGRIAHAYLFCGPRGTGKTTTARLLAKAINCKKLSDGEPCDTCEFCQAIREGNLIDLIEIDAASNRGIDEIRDLREKIRFAPTRAPKKIYIIDEVHMLTKEAFNALLKTLEEPPPHAHFILATTEPHKIPETILSRCQRFDFHRIDERTLATRLSYIAQKERIAADDDALELISQYADGGLRDAITLLEQMTVQGALKRAHVEKSLSMGSNRDVQTFYDLLVQGNMTKAMTMISSLYKDGIDLTQFTREFLGFLRHTLLAAVRDGKSNDITQTLHFIHAFQEAYEGLRHAVIMELPLEVAIVHVCHARHMPHEAPPQMPAPTPQAVLPVVKTVQQHRPLKDISIETIRDNWPRVLDHIAIPALRRSLAQARINSFSGSTIHLTFQSNFHCEKVNTAGNQVKILQALEVIFGKKLAITCSVEKVDFKPTIDNPFSEQHALAEHAAELFSDFSQEE